MAHHLRPVKTPDNVIQDPWFSEQVECFFQEKLSEYYNMKAGKELKNIEVNQSDVQLIPNSDLALTLTIELDEEGGKVRAQFFGSNSCIVAGVTADVM